jgi:large subunit ribosomal protein L7/L12
MFDIVLKDGGDNKIGAIKVVREITELGLKEAKDLVDGAPQTVKEGVKKEEAEEIKAKFEEVGATVELA